MLSKKLVCKLDTKSYKVFFQQSLFASLLKKQTERQSTEALNVFLPRLQSTFFLKDYSLHLALFQSETDFHSQTFVNIINKMLTHSCMVQTLEATHFYCHS